MALALIAVTAIGFLIGLRLRVPALIAATLAVIVASAAGGGLMELSISHALRSMAYLVLTLQGSYLVGLAFAVLWRRLARNRRT